MPSLLYTPVVLRSGLLLGLMALLLAPPARAQELFILRVIGGFFEPKAPVPEPGPSAPAVPGSMPEAQFQELLVKGDLQALNLACVEADGFGFNKRLQLLQARLLEMAPKVSRRSHEKTAATGRWIVAQGDGMTIPDEIKAPKVTGSPAEIWLVYGDIDRDCTHAECAEVTWCEDKQHTSDVRYVRADVAEAMAADAVDAERERCAKMADEYATWGGSNFYAWFKKLAAAIRA